MICRSLKWSLCAVVAGLSLLPAGSAFAYTVGGGSSGTGPTGVAPGTPFTFTAQFLQPNGTPVPAGVGVTFSEQSGPTAAAAAPARLMMIGGRSQRISLAASTCVPTFNPVSTVTDSTGSASTSVTLPTGCPGQFVLAATLAGGGTVTFSVAETGGFPNTTVDRAHALPWWLLVAGAAVLVVLAVGGGARLWSARPGLWT